MFTYCGIVKHYDDKTKTIIKKRILRKLQRQDKTVLLLCLVLVTIVHVSSNCAGENRRIWGFITLKQKQSLKHHGFFP